MDLSKAKIFLSEKKPEILTTVGIIGMFTTIALAIKATPKAVEIISEIKEEDKTEDPKEISKQIIKRVAPVYIPTTISAGLSVTCFIASVASGTRRYTLLASAYAISDNFMRDYQDKVIDIIGEKKERQIRDAVAKEQIAREPVTSKEVIITSSGDTLFFEPISNRYFKSDIEKIRKIENILNKRMLSENYISLNDFYYEIELSGTEIGDSIGFNIDNGFIEFNFSALLTDDGRPCIVIGYLNEPKYGFNRFG